MADTNEQELEGRTLSGAALLELTGGSLRGPVSKDALLLINSLSNVGLEGRSRFRGPLPLSWKGETVSWVTPARAVTARQRLEGQSHFLEPLTIARLDTAPRLPELEGHSHFLGLGGPLFPSDRHGCSLA